MFHVMAILIDVCILFLACGQTKGDISYKLVPTDIPGHIRVHVFEVAFVKLEGAQAFLVKEISEISTAAYIESHVYRWLLCRFAFAEVAQVIRVAYEHVHRDEHFVEMSQVGDRY